MRALKFIGVLLLLILVVIFTIPLILPDHAQVSQSITINAKAQTVFRQVNKLKNWRNWSPFEGGDSNMESIYEGPEMGVGSKHSWKSKNMGDGSLTILKSQPYSFIQSEMEMNGGGVALDEWTFAETSTGVEVTWTLKLSNLKYPFHRYFGFFIESMMRPMQEKGLQKLKEVSEASRQSIDIEVVDLKSFHSFTIMDSAMMGELETLMKKNMDELSQYFKKYKVQPAGPPFAMFYNWETEKPIRMRVGYPIFEETKETGRVNYFSTISGTAIRGTMLGGYAQAYAAHNDMDAYMADFGLKQSAKPVWEMYLVSSHTEPDSTKWITHIYYYFD